MNGNKARRLGGLDNLAYVLVCSKLILQEHKGFIFLMLCKTCQKTVAIYLLTYSWVLPNITN